MQILVGEAERIKRCKGRVFALQDEPEVHRVWLPFDDAPGLAMARAFGDFCLKEYGVISIPEFSHRLLTDKDQFIVLASDGVRIFNLMFSFICSFIFFILYRKLFQVKLICSTTYENMLQVCNFFKWHFCFAVSCLGMCERHQNCLNYVEPIVFSTH